ncbi:MAG: hypothetical protein ACXVZR_03740, partial [Terriglobales bacterium]
VPWWVPEIMRLKRLEAELRHYQMGMGKLAPKLGIVGADVIALAQPATPPAPVPVCRSGSAALQPDQALA